MNDVKIYKYYGSNSFKNLSLTIAAIISVFLCYKIGGYIKDLVPEEFNVYLDVSPFSYQSYQPGFLSSIYIFIFVLTISVLTDLFNSVISKAAAQLNYYNNIKVYDEYLILPKKYYWKNDDHIKIFKKEIIRVSNGLLPKSIILEFKDSESNISTIKLVSSFFSNKKEYDELKVNLLSSHSF